MPRPSKSLRQPTQSWSPADSASDFLLDWIGDRTGPNERRQVVVLACGYEPLSEVDPPTDPEELAQLLQVRKRSIAEIVARYGGSVAAVTPARLIVYWGWQETREDDTRLAVAAALEIIESTGRQCRCALDAGIAVVEMRASGAGDGSQLVAAAVGKAHAMLAEAHAGAIVVSATVRSLLGGVFDLEPFGRPSGAIGVPYRAWIVTGAAAGRTNTAWVAHETLFGREQEQSVLAAAWAEVGGGAVRRIWIHGEAGIGKTALLADLKARIASTSVTFIEAHCLPETQGTFLSPVHQILDDLAELGFAEPGPHASEHTIDPQTPRDARAMAASVAARLVRPPAPGPVVLAVEDVHWADPQSLEFIAALAEHIAGAGPTLLVVTSRGPAPEPMLERAVWTALELGRLGVEELLRMLRTPTLVPQLDAPLQHFIALHAEGIPLYARELAWLTAKGPDRLVSESHYRLLSSPNRLNAALLARLDAVGELKHLAQAASVLGRVLETRVLAAVLEADITALKVRLDALVARGLLLPAHEPPGAHYRFSHTLLWSTAYGSLLKSQRRQLHARAAAILSSSFPELAKAASERVAHHFEKAGDHANAFAWWQKAALQADAAGDTAKAVSHIDRALSAKSAAPGAGTALDEAQLHSLLGKQLGVLHGNASVEAVAAYQRSMALLSQLPARPDDIRFDIQWGLCSVHLVRGEVEAALETSTGLIEEARAAGRTDRLIVALRMHGTAKLLHGCVRDAIDLYRMIEAHYEPGVHGLIGYRYVSDQGIVASAHLAWATAIAGQDEASLAAERKALALIGEREHAHTSANVLGVLATAAMIRGEAGTAAALAHACQDLSEAQRFEYWRARADLVLGWVEGRRDPGRGLPLVQAARERYRRTGSVRAASFADIVEAEIALRAGSPKLALAALARSESAGGTSPRCIYASEILRLRALALYTADPAQHQTAHATLDRAERIAAEQGALGFARRIAQTRDLIARRSGVRSSAHASQA